MSDTLFGRAVALVAIVAAIVAVLLLISEGEEELDVARGTRRSPGAAAAPDADLVLIDAGDERRAEPLVVDTGGEAPPEPAPPEPAPSAPGLRVLVVDDDDEPVAGIPVALRVRKPESPGFIDMLTAESDERGLATLELPARSVVDGVLRVDDSTFQLALALPLTPAVSLDLGTSVEAARLLSLVVPFGVRRWLEPLAVRVVDPRGEPVGGVTVELQAVSLHDLSNDDMIERAESRDADGIAEIPRRAIIDHARRLSLLGFGISYRVVADGAFDRLPMAPVTAEPQGDVVTLELPPTGEVVVRVTSAEGEPVDEGPSVAVWTRPVGADDDVRWERMHRHIREVHDGIARYEHVGLGLDLRFSVGHSGWKGTSLEAAGPTQDGQRVELQARLGPPVPTLVGRVVDVDGAPLADTWIFLTFVPNVPPPETGGSPPSSKYLSTTTDGDGFFRNPFYGPASVAGGRRVDVEEKRREGFARGVIPRYARGELPEPLPDAGEIDLGELVMTPLPTLLSGRVVDPDGAPVNHARLWIRYPYGQGDAERWFNLNVPSKSTEADGTFAVHGLQRARQLRISASRKGLGASREVTVTPGATGVELALVPPEPEPRGGEVVGQVLLDEGVPGLSLEIYLKWQGGSEDDYVWPTGGFRFEGVPEGTASLRIETQETDFTVARVEGIPVRVGETTTVDPIDLRGALRVLQLRVLKDTGHPVSEGWCWVRTADGEGGSFRTDRDGRARFLVRTRDELFGIRSSGYAATECAWSETEQTVVLVAAEG